ncbi:Cellulose synthase [Cynara cardunculus var. scolymus]|uniref:Cellulose synthase n=1 Tax=Cynara cardunculus var. scolymus TaxID=59895 RepID=A0A103XR23_CYNCS|nr:Cellulose synthase [Cynara cardunculus var. scolymus]
MLHGYRSTKPQKNLTNRSNSMQKEFETENNPNLNLQHNSNLISVQCQPYTPISNSPSSTNLSFTMLKPSLHLCKPSPARFLNRAFIFIYGIAILALFYRHFLNLTYSPSLTTISLFISDVVLAFLWVTWQAFFLNPLHRQVFPENLPQVAKETEYPGLDVFVLTADPFKEPPVAVVNTALSVLAFDYPTEKLSVYVSDDGGSQLTLFAFMEAAKFAKYWLPYCRKYKIMDRSPQVYFGKNPSLFPETKDIQRMFEKMKDTIQNVVDRGTIDEDEINDDPAIKAFAKWTREFTRHQHPTIIEVLLKNDVDKDIRVSTILTNAPIFLTVDCDMYSNNPKTPLHVLCFFLDPNVDPKLAFVQFPQRYHSINKNDTYGAEFLLETQVCPLGMDSWGGTLFMGTGGFFRRQALLEDATEPLRLWNEPIDESGDVLQLAHRVASCNYEKNTKWGHEDIFTGFRLHCSGWKSVTCNPTRAAFLGNTPRSLHDFLSQMNRWYMGMLQIGLSKFSPITFGMKFLNPLHALCYSHYLFRAFWSIPVSDPWFSLYVFLFVGAYGKELIDYVMAGSGFKRWWNHQRQWLIMGCSSYPFSIFDWLLTSLGMSICDFNVTNKASNNEISKRYEQGFFEFGVESSLLLAVSLVAVVNIIAFVMGIKQVLMNTHRFEELFMQLFIAGFGVVNSLPVYEGLVLRSDNGKIPMKIGLKSVGFSCMRFSFLGAYGKDCLDFVVFGGSTMQRWWSYQRMWLIWVLSGSITLYTRLNKKPAAMAAPLLHSSKPLSNTWLNRIFILIFAGAVSIHLLRRCRNLIYSPTPISTALFVADFVLAFMWLTCQSFHWKPIRRRVFPENLQQVVAEREYPALDVFICTADPKKEPPIGVVNTVMSVLAFEYPPEKMSVYISDDGGSEVALYAFMEGAGFAKQWIPYCKKHKIVDRSPEVYFGSDPAWFPDTDEIKAMYESMKSRVERVVQNGCIHMESEFREAFHNNVDKDSAGGAMPNLIYLSRQKSNNKPHNFKAGALNVLLRVSGVMTNSPIVLLLDCDMYSNDPQTPLRALCYFMDPNADPKLGFVQFPQRFDGINKNDIYASEFKHETQILSLGMDGLRGAPFMGTGGFFKRHVISMRIDSKPVKISEDVLAAAYQVASSNYEDNTKWGSKIGFRYGTVTEDTYTSFRLHCEGWKSILCNPKRAAFLGGSPSSLNDNLTQMKRWYMGFLDIFFNKYCPITYGIRSMNPLQALCYTHYSLPYGKDFLDFVVFAGGTMQRWWSYQRMWLIWGLSSCPFALLEWSLKSVGISTIGFNVTCKMIDEEQNSRYEQGLFEFGVESVLFFLISVASLTNLLSLVKGVTEVFMNGRLEELFVQILICGFGVVNSWPIYEGMFLRRDGGRMPLKITLASMATAMVICLVSPLVF